MTLRVIPIGAQQLSCCSQRLYCCAHSYPVVPTGIQNVFSKVYFSKCIYPKCIFGNVPDLRVLQALRVYSCGVCHTIVCNKLILGLRFLTISTWSLSSAFEWSSRTVNWRLVKKDSNGEHVMFVLNAGFEGGITRTVGAFSQSIYFWERIAVILGAILQ